MKLCLWIAALLLVVVGTNAGDGGFDLGDALDPDPETEKPKKPTSGGGVELDLMDAVEPDPEPEKPKKPTSGGGDPNPKPAVPPNTGGGGGGGGGGGFDDSDLWDDSKGELKPEGGAGGQDPYNDGGADQPQDPWVRALRVLEANMPEGVHIWLANIKHSLVPLLERALQLLDGLV